MPLALLRKSRINDSILLLPFDLHRLRSTNHRMMERQRPRFQHIHDAIPIPVVYVMLRAFMLCILACDFRRDIKTELQNLTQTKNAQYTEQSIKKRLSYLVINIQSLLRKKSRSIQSQDKKFIPCLALFNFRLFSLIIQLLPNFFCLCILFIHHVPYITQLSHAKFPSNPCTYLL